MANSSRTTLRWRDPLTPIAGVAISSVSRPRARAVGAPVGTASVFDRPALALLMALATASQVALLGVSALATNMLSGYRASEGRASSTARH